ncbi:hypothetical protein FQR65_LT08200 [Abscondita terminalis]|nr:hypothetical protein FQR65_LT08200 [Abscondita terminalis]
MKGLDPSWQQQDDTEKKEEEESNFVRRKSKSSKNKKTVKSKKKRKNKTTKYNVTSDSEDDSSIENKENQSTETSSNLEADNELRIVHIVEKELRSDIKDKLYQRYCAQIQNNEEAFIYWTNLVKEEMMKLNEVIAVEDIQWYIKTALLSLIGGKRNSKVQSS